MRLIYKHNQEHHFKIITYPDGQQNVELDLNYFNDVKKPVDIICSVRNFKELEVLWCLVTALIRNDFVIGSIKFNYLFGMRSDRAFAQGQPNYFRDVVSRFINGFPFPKKILYPHSRISMATLLNARPDSIGIDGLEDCFKIGADESACWSEYPLPLPHFHKKRTDAGLIAYLSSELREEIRSLPAHVPLLIKDDLCDGGATFIAIADSLKIHFPERKRYLFVAHGLFTKGIDHVTEHYDKVFTTNSYQDFPDHPLLDAINVWGV